ncbi:hypothetical protein, partial [Staphylococcus aureus]
MSRGLGDVYKRQTVKNPCIRWVMGGRGSYRCLLYTSDAADDSLRVDLGGRRIIKKTHPPPPPPPPPPP